MRDKSFQITKQQYDYLFPIFGNIGTKQLLNKVDMGIDKYFFIGTDEQYKDLLNRCAYIN